MILLVQHAVWLLTVSLEMPKAQKTKAWDLRPAAGEWVCYIDRGARRLPITPGQRIEA